MNDAKSPMTWLGLVLAVFSLALGIYVNVGWPGSPWRWDSILMPAGILLLIAGGFIGVRKPAAKRALSVLSMAFVLASMYFMFKRLG